MSGWRCIMIIIIISWWASVRYAVQRYAIGWMPLFPAYFSIVFIVELMHDLCETFLMCEYISLMMNESKSYSKHKSHKIFVWAAYITGYETQMFENELNAKWKANREKIETCSNVLEKAVMIAIKCADVLMCLSKPVKYTFMMCTIGLTLTLNRFNAKITFDYVNMKEKEVRLKKATNAWYLVHNTIKWIRPREHHCLFCTLLSIVRCALPSFLSPIT